MQWKFWQRHTNGNRNAHDDLAREIRAHLDEEADDQRAAGLSHSEARDAAKRAFGSVAMAIEDTRATWRFAAFERIAQDVSYALRLMRKSPGFTSVVVLSLALGIGANTAIFSMMDAIVLRSLPVSHPEQLYLLAPAGPQGHAAFSYPGLEVLRRTNQVFSETFNFAESGEWNVIVNGRAEMAPGGLVTGNYFAGLGVGAIAGRMITDSDDTPAAPLVAVISYRFWQRRFGLDAAALGSTLTLNGTVFTIVGIAPPQFTGLSVGSPMDLWIPMSAEPLLARDRSLLTSNGTWWLLGMGRLKPGVTEAQARASLESILPALREAMGITDDNNGPAKGRFSYIEMTPGNSGLSQLTTEYALPLRILMIIVGLVLLIACANVANLLLSRASARQREMAIRLALGGGRRRLLQQLLIESLLLAVLAGALGLVFASWGERALINFFAAQRSTFGLDLSLNGRVLTFTIVTSLLTGILFGLAPALRATRLDPGETLKQHASNIAKGGTRLSRRLSPSRALIVLQVAVSLLLLAGAGLFLRTLQNLRGMDFGFNPEHVLLMTIEPTLAGYGDTARQLALYREAIDRFNATPGVQAASGMRFGLIGGGYSGRNIFIADNTDGKDRTVAYNLVAARFFEAMGITQLRGRDFRASDTASSPKVVIVNEKFARYYFGTVDVVGRRIGFDGKSPAEMEIIGVVRDTKFFRLRAESPRQVFTPIMQNANGNTLERMTIAIRTAADPASMANTLRRELQSIASDVPIRNVKTQVELLDNAMSRERLLASLSAMFGGLALMLACIGLYGVMSYAVVRRTTEIGIRMALGARRADVIRMVLRDSAWLVIAGIIAGLAAFVFLARLVESQLFALKPNDPATLAIASVLLITAAAIAAFLPAWRAARVDPLVALRYE